MPVKQSARKMGDIFGGQALFGRITQKTLFFILYLFGLVVLYISFHYTCEKTLLESRAIEKELKALKADYTSKAAALMFLSQQKEVEKQLERKKSGLHAPSHPPQRIKPAANE